MLNYSRADIVKKWHTQAISGIEAALRCTQEQITNLDMCKKCKISPETHTHIPCVQQADTNT